MSMIVLPVGILAAAVLIIWGLQKEPDIPAEICAVVGGLITAISWFGLYTQRIPDNKITAAMAFFAPIIMVIGVSLKNNEGYFGWFDWSRPDPPPKMPEPVKPPIVPPTASVDTYGVGRWHTREDLNDTWGGKNTAKSLLNIRFKD